MKKLICLIICLTFIQSPLFAMEYDDLNSVKEPAYRIGASDDIETKIEYKNEPQTETVKSSDISAAKLTYADLSIKKISKELSQSLDMDYDIMMSDLSLLWQGAATKSDTIKFAIYKLSNPEADKPDEKSIKKVITTIASMSTLVGAGIGNPLLASGAFLGGNILGIMAQDDKTANYKFTKVNDADMIILVRKIEDLQQNLVNTYYDYITTRKIYDMTTKIVAKRYQNYKMAQDASKEIVLIADAYYREARDMQIIARGDYYSKRATLEQLVGTEIFKQFESIINSRIDD